MAHPGDSARAAERTAELAKFLEGHGFLACPPGDGNVSRTLAPWQVTAVCTAGVATAFRVTYNVQGRWADGAHTLCRRSGPSCPWACEDA